MLLAFATFVGLGGDDIPKTILSICLGLVFAAVGFDQISGEPRLVFFDISGFLHGINFLVLAIGVYGIGEMLWTIDTTRGKIATHRGQDDLRRASSRTPAKCFRRGWKGMSIGSFLGFFVGILPAAGATPGSLMAYGVAKMASRNPELLRQGQSRRRRGTGIGQQLGLDRLDAADADAGHPRLADHRDPARRHGDLGPDARPAALRRPAGIRLGPDRLVLRVELLRRWSSTSSFIPLFIWMLRMPFTILAPMIFVLSIVGGYAATQRHARRLADADLRAGRVLPAQVRLSAGAGGAGHRARPDRRADAAPVAAAVLGRSVDLLHPADRRRRSRSSRILLILLPPSRWVSTGCATGRVPSDGTFDGPRPRGPRHNKRPRCGASPAAPVPTKPAKGAPIRMAGTVGHAVKNLRLASGNTGRGRPDPRLAGVTRT